MIAGAILLIWLTQTLALAQAPLLPAAGVNATAPSRQTNDVGGIRSLVERLANARSDFAAAKALADGNLTPLPVGVSPEEASLRLGLLQRLVRIHEQQIGNAEELETVKQNRAEIVREARSWTGFSEPRPYSILLADRLREQIQSERLEARHAEAALALFDQLMEDNRNSLTESEERIRLINEQLEGAGDPAVTGRLAWQREVERLRSRVAAESITLFNSQEQIMRERLTASPIRLGLLQRQVVIVDAEARFTQNELDRVLAGLEDERRQIERELAAAETRLGAARDELRGIQPQPDADPAAAARAAEQVEMRRAQLETAETAVKALRLILENGNTERTMWKLRFATFASGNVEALRQAEQRRENFALRQAEQRRENFALRVGLFKDYHRQQLDVSSSQIASEEARLNRLGPGSDLTPFVRDRLAALRERDDYLLRVVRQAERAERLLQRWDEGLQAAAGKLPLTGRLRHLFSTAGSFSEGIWNFELFAAEDAIIVDGQRITGKRSVTLGKIVKAIAILLAGYWITGVISHLVGPFLVRRLKIEPNQALLTRRWLRVVLVIGLLVVSLLSVKIPLTVFAFAGGALAIGLGFGTQTLLKNFVSGIIILFERPFRVGDVIDVGQHRGTVTGIGLRSSVLRLWDDTEMLIPNSTLLENNLTNWTYSNRTVRFSVAVGVVYGSDPRRVIQLLAEVADRHGLVEKDPRPQMLFTEFGDNALSFELRFWVNVVKTNAAQISSELRQMIAAAFVENGIGIAFPQRDIHLDTSRPLQVQMVPAPTTGPAAPEETRHV